MDPFCFGHFNALGYENLNKIGDNPGEMPPPPVNLGGTVVQLVAGNTHNCALLETGVVRCWGINNQGQLGIGNQNTIGDGPGEMPPANTNVGAGVVLELVAGYASSCALFDNGDLRCWGWNHVGQLGQPGFGIGDNGGEMPPPNVNYGGGVVIGVEGSTSFGVLLQSGDVRMWGEAGGYGYPPSINDLGDDPGEMPPANIAIGGTAIMYGHGGSAYHSCVVLPDQSVHCWGLGGSGATGYGNTLTVGDAVNELPPPAVQTY